MYFGRVADAPPCEAALQEYLNNTDDLHAGRTPQRDKEALTVRELCNRFLNSKRIELDAGKLSPRTFVDYDRVCRRLAKKLGETRAVTGLGPTDFEGLYADLISRYSLNTVSGEITMTRSVFRYAVVFLTKYGQRWVRFEVVEIKRFGKVAVKAKQDDAIAKQNAKLLRKLGFKRHGVSFYALRHTFETRAGESKDQVAVAHIMGHVDSTMASEYREEISDARLRFVVDVVHEWLFTQEADDGAGPDVLPFTRTG